MSVRSGPCLIKKTAFSSLSRRMKSVTRFAHERAKDPVKVERREMSEPRERFQIQRIREIFADVVDHAVDATNV